MIACTPTLLTSHRLAGESAKNGAHHPACSHLINGGQFRSREGRALENFINFPKRARSPIGRAPAADRIGYQCCRGAKQEQVSGVVVVVVVAWPNNVTTTGKQTAGRKSNEKAQGCKLGKLVASRQAASLAPA